MKIRSPKLLLFILLIIFLLFIDIYSYLPEDLESPYVFKDEICSYNGEVNLSASNKTYIKCNCKEDFDNDPNMTMYINGVKIQCSYLKKRRLTALFLAIFVPLGFDHVYLENYQYFLPIFILCCTTIIGNCVIFICPIQEAKKNYFENKENIYFAVLILICIVVWLINIILIGLGITTDGKGINTVNDIPVFANSTEF